MKPIKLNAIEAHFGEIDLFISAISFESRCLSLINSINANKIKTIWFTYNKNEQEFYLDNIESAMRNREAELIEFSTDNPLVTAKSLIQRLNSIDKVENVVLDISTFTHEGLLIIFKYLNIYKEKILNLSLAYVGAAKYSINESNDDDKWLSKGTKTIRSIIGYPGVINPANKNHLIILFGFEIERTQQLIESFEFDIVSIGIGPEGDSIDSEHYNINRKRHIELLEQYPFAETFEFSLTNPFQTKKEIEKQISKYEKFNVVITPLNNKMSTIGVALAALENPKVQVCYVRAHEYNYKGYSEPSDNCYTVKLY